MGIFGTFFLGIIILTAGSFLFSWVFKMNGKWNWSRILGFVAFLGLWLVTLRIFPTERLLNKFFWVGLLFSAVFMMCVIPVLPPKGRKDDVITKRLDRDPFVVLSYALDISLWLVIATMGLVVHVEVL